MMNQSSTSTGMTPHVIKQLRQLEMMGARPPPKTIGRPREEDFMVHLVALFVINFKFNFIVKE